jgi:hypothetical protein
MAVDLCKKCKVCKACGKLPYIAPLNPATGGMAYHPYTVLNGIRYEPCGDEEYF